MNNNWRTVPLSEIADINPRLGKTTLSDDSLYSFVPMASVGVADGSIDVTVKRPYAEVKKGFTLFQPGDVLFAKITPCMEEIDRRLSVTEELEATIETNLKRAERLRQTILQQAFSGGFQ